ncbi:MAG: (d)CMP kinase [Deltaproteobacteria bacterium]|nr:(d)CMP kinase [Deltaproteobacteria bacterium]
MSAATRKQLTIAIDGPAGAGKSTVAKRVALALGYSLVDTGAIYRAVALMAVRRGIPLEDDQGLEAVVAALELSFSFQAGVNHVWISGVDVSDAIRTPEISLAASTVSARPVVRTGLLELQRRLAGHSGVVLEGRDIGTVVFPEAEIKIFLDASDEERARRRFAELVARGERPVFERVFEEQRRRDAQDRGRAVAPLKAAVDAVRLDSTVMSIDQVVEAILEVARARGA